MISILTVIVAFGATSCFIPAIVEIPFYTATLEDPNDFPLQRAIHSYIFEYALVGGIAVSVPVLFELIADTLSVVSNKHGASKLHSEAIFSKWILLSAIIIPHVLLLTKFGPENQFHFVPMLCASEQIIHFHCLLSFLKIYGSPIWTYRRVGFLVIIFMIAKISECFSAFHIMTDPIFLISRFILYLVQSVVLVFLGTLWILHIMKQKRLNKGISIEEYCCNIHLVAVAVGFFGLWSMYFIGSSAAWSGITATGLAGLYILPAVYNVLISAWNGRIIRKEMAVAQTNQELETKRMFVRYVSHEIRTPLNTVAMGLQLLRTELSKIRRNETMLDIVQDLSVSCDTAVDILNDLLTYEKLTANILQLDSAVISVKKFVSEVVRPFFMQATQAGIELSIVFGEGLLDESMDMNIVGDKGKLSQVLRNLLSNALKFTKMGGRVTVEITREARSSESAKQPPGGARGSRRRFSLTPGLMKAVTARMHHPVTARNPKIFTSASDLNHSNVHVVLDDTTDGLLKIDVKDTGVGISEENQKRLFKEIVQFNPGELQDGKGSGLGLWISSRIMELHGGDLTMFSNGLGSGCTFTLTIPLSHRGNASHQPSQQQLHRGCSRDNSSAYELHTNDRHLEYIEEESEPRAVSAVSTHPNNKDHDNSSNNVEGKDEGDSDGDGERGRCTDAVDNTTGAADVVVRPLDEILRGCRVLLVDDVAMNRKMLNRLLRDRCQHITEAEDGKQALDTILASLRDSSQPAVDVVIMDFQMPVMDGPTAVREMRSAGYRGVVIGLTGNALPSDIDFFLSEGADRVMIKPCKLELLRSILEGEESDDNRIPS